MAGSARCWSAYGIRIAYTPWGVLVAMVFIGLPFTVRTVQPVLGELGQDVEEAAATLGATRLQTIARVVMPMLLPAMLTGAAMAFARGAGEYGSIIFIAGNIPAVSEIAPLLIVTKLEQFDYAGAAAIGVVMLAASFVMLLALNGLQTLGGEAAMKPDDVASTIPPKIRCGCKLLLGAIALAFIAVLLLLPLVAGVQGGLCRWRRAPSGRHHRARHAWRRCGCR